MKTGSIKPGTRLPRVNLWVLLIGFLLLATCFVGAIFFHWFTQLGSKFNALADFECEAAISAYESGGSQKLDSVMRMHQAQSGVRAYLFDESGGNLGTGPDRGNLLAVEPLYLRVLSRLSGRQVRDFDARIVPQSGNYSCVVISDLENRAFYGNRAVRMLALLSLLCYGVAGYVIVRMRRLEAAIQSFGAGKLEVRVPSGNRDPIRRLSDAFNQMAERVESLVDSHRRLCIDISHELRSPLTRLRLAIGLARSGTQGALEQIELESYRLNELVDQLLDVARAEVDPEALGRERVDLQSMVAGIVDECAIEARERGCEITLYGDDPTSIVGDPELLRRAIENPLRNAIRHSPVRSPIEVSCSGNGDGAIVTIRDSGNGIPDSELEVVFKPFYRVEADRDRHTGGAGLGLAIAKRAITLHRGSVKAENANPGLRIQIHLPRE
jgi:signal transduction histidine kinase